MGSFMESISAYFTTDPEKFTLFVICAAIIVLYFIMSKLIKLTIAIVLVIFVVSAISLSKDPAPMSVKMHKTAETFIVGGKQLMNRFGDFWRDSKEVAGEAKKLPGDINKLLDAPVDSGTKDKDAAKKK